jgi:DNA-binding NarL/FixJ family response regulator
MLPGKINVLIVDDEVLLRQGLRSMLEKEEFIDEIFEAEDEATFTNLLISQKIDVVLLDVRLRKTNGIELLQKTKSIKSKPFVIALTGLDGIEVILNLLKSDVHGIIYKLDGYNEVLKAIKCVQSTGSYFPENILNIIRSNANRWEHVPPVLFSFQERELLKAIAGGSTTKQIAAELKMTPSTTETYRTRLMKKVGVPNTAALLAYAFRNGLL